MATPSGLLFAALACVLVSTTCADLPYFVVQADNHYDAGFSVGRYFSDRINGYLAAYPYLKNTLMPFINTTAGQQVFEQLVSINMKAYPQYFEEMRGIADGAKVDHLTIILLNLQTEVGGLMANVTRHDTACSDLMLYTNQAFVMAHNEDADPLVKSFSYIVTFTIGNEVSFTSYNYPGYLPGNSFGFNAHRMIFTTNALFPGAVPGGLGRMFINRDTLLASSVDDAIRRATPRIGPIMRSSGWSLNVGSMDEKRIINVEVAHVQYAVYEVAGGNYSHFNMYKELNLPSQWIDASSVHRQARVDQFPVPTSYTDMLNILGDSQDATYPIFRDGQPPDAAATVATARYDLIAGDFFVYLQNPKTNSTPAFHLSMKA